jgi:hypothetical protein
MSRPATSRLKVNPVLGMRPSLEFRRLAELRIDPSYQRTTEAGASQTLIRRIAMFWDWSLCQPLAVAKRDDGALMVVDGQHRLEAARLRGDIDDLPCVVTAYRNAGDEAAAFVALNQQRRPLSQIDLFKAALAAEDETACSAMPARSSRASPARWRRRSGSRRRSTWTGWPSCWPGNRRRNGAPRSRSRRRGPASSGGWRPRI